MKELQAKWVFEQGGFSKALVACVQRGGTRQFKTIDAAVQTARNIGFRRVEVDLSGMRD